MEIISQTGKGAAVLANICVLLVSHAKYCFSPTEAGSRKPEAGGRKSEFVSGKSSEFLCSTAIKRLLAVCDKCHFVFLRRPFTLLEIISAKKQRYFKQTSIPFAIETCIAYIE